MPLEIEWGKLFLLLVIIICTTAMLIVGVISEAPGVGIMGLVVGYITGNGRLASRGKPSIPAIGRSAAPEVAPTDG